MASTVHSRLAAGLPWWLSGVLGIACVLLGAVLTLRPFVSLGALVVLLALGLALTGLLHVTGRRGEGIASRLVGLAWIAGGIAVLALPGLTIAAVTLIVAVGLVVSGVVRIAGLRQGGRDGRVSGLLLGIASILLGVVALTWPDVTVLAVAAVFGVQLVLFGVDRAQEAWRRRPGAPAEVSAATRWTQQLVADRRRRRGARAGSGSAAAQRPALGDAAARLLLRRTGRGARRTGPAPGRGAVHT